MPAAVAASLTDFVLGLASAPAGQDAGNRFSIEGLTFASLDDGTREIRIRKFEAASLRLASGALTLEVGQAVLHQLVARVRIEGGKPRLGALEAAGADLSEVKLAGPLPEQAAAGSWSLDPLATADGVVNAEIVDAKLLFDADVKVPIRQGLVDFNEATVEHVGPDSRMGVSRLGIYVDSPNGRSYLYQFPSTLVAGVEYERRSPLPGPWGTRRGNLRLQPFGEELLRQAPGGHGPGITEQARLLFDRTAVSGHVQLGDGKFAAPGLQADLFGRAAGHNVVRLRSQAVGRGLDVDVASLSVRNAAWSPGGTRLACDEATGALVLQFLVEGTQVRIALQLARMKLSGLRLHLP